MRFTACTLCIFSLLLTFEGSAQNSVIQAFDKLPVGTELPEELQSSRSIVILKADPTSPIGTDDDRALLTEQFHSRLVAMHIDAVAYYRWQDIITGYDATRSYLEAIKGREVSQVIFLVAENDQYKIYMIPTTDGDMNLKTERSVWTASNPTLEGVVDNLATAVRATDLEIANFLISDSPEFFIDTQIFIKNRFESFQPDLKLDKLAVPLFTGIDTDSIQDPTDRELKSMFEDQYPFYYEVVSTKMTEDLMKKAGFHYVLRYLHGEESTLLTLLDYNIDSSDPRKTGYKFYVKHLISGDIYLGDSWDSRSTWQSALNLHLTNMKKSLKVE